MYYASIYLVGLGNNRKRLWQDILRSSFSSNPAPTIYKLESWLIQFLGMEHIEIHKLYTRLTYITLLWWWIYKTPRSLCYCYIRIPDNQLRTKIYRNFLQTCYNYDLCSILMVLVHTEDCISSMPDASKQCDGQGCIVDASF